MKSASRPNLKTETLLSKDELTDRLSLFYGELCGPVKILSKGWKALHRKLLRSELHVLHDDAERIHSAVLLLNELTEQLSNRQRIEVNINSESAQSILKTIRHDLRTPINAIKGYGEIVLEDLGHVGDADVQEELNNLLAQSEVVIATIGKLQEEPNSNVQVMTAGNFKILNINSRSSATIGGSILVVDDIESNRSLLQRHLQHQGHVVSCAEDGVQALSMLSIKSFDLVLLDMLMPGMDGYEVLKRIKADEHLRDTPVIVVSALDEMESVINCIEAGAEDYLPKPFDPTLLKARIGTGLEKKRLRDETKKLVKRLEGELDEAKLAQLRMVPHEFPEATLRQPYSVYGYMQPAREVGGDFYDFYSMGEDHVWFLVGDVSDKGVASGMFMARAVALVRLIPAQIFEYADAMLLPHEVLERLNRELCVFNDEMTFVTLLLARLNVRTGELCISNAGHPAPCVLSAGQEVRELDANRGRPLGIRTDSCYQTSSSQLTPLQMLFFYTDGVTDAQNIAGEKYEEQRTQAQLNSDDAQSPQKLVDRLCQNISEFVGGADQFDDITMLALRWEGDAFCVKKHFSLKNDLHEIGPVSNRVGLLFREQDLSPSFYNDFFIAIDEVLSNVVQYAYSDEQEHIIDLHAVIDFKSVTMRVEDDGRPFDPLKQEPPNLKASIDERSKGGVGIQFVVSLMDECEYERINNRNHFTFSKFISKKLINEPNNGEG